MSKRTISTVFRNDFKGSDAYTRHVGLIRSYMQYYGGQKPTNIPSEYKTERDIVRENLKFVHDDLEGNATWEQRVAKKYYDKLFKEYAICELKYYKEGKIALRWRTEKEVMTGKGQFICGSTRCDEDKALHSWEVNFGYMEDSEKKNELVKVRLCVKCSDKLNHKTKKRLAKTLKKKQEEREENQRRKKKSKRTSDDASSETEQESEEDTEEIKRKQENSVWSKALEPAEEKTKEEEYEDYFADLLQ